MSIPEEAIEAAARTKHENSRQGGLSRWETETDSYRTYLMDEARDELEAAMPAIREAIAQEIEISNYRPWCTGIDEAARIARGGTPWHAQGQPGQGRVGDGVWGRTQRRRRGGD